MIANSEAAPQLHINRRDFLTSTVAVGGPMVLGFHLPARSARADVIPREPWYRDATVPEVNAWLNDRARRHGDHSCRANRDGHRRIDRRPVGLCVITLSFAASSETGTFHIVAAARRRRSRASAPAICR
jgi:hypothetical protein